jgi:myosin V
MLQMLSGTVLAMSSLIHLTKHCTLLLLLLLLLQGARTEHFLLEKSRLVKVDASERSYHIFYQLCCGLPDSEAAALGLTAGSQAFHAIAQGGCVDIGDDVDDGKEFAATSAALSTLGFTAEDKAGVWKLLAAILHMGNASFSDTAAAASAAASASAEGELSAGSEGAVSAADLTVMASSEHITLSELAQLLGLSGDSLSRRVVRRAMMTARGSSHEIPLNSSQAKDNLDGLVKHIYGKLFAWVVWKINQCHKEQVLAGVASPTTATTTATAGTSVSSASGGSGSTAAPRSFIGILDIFGFEIMTCNSFEQLCINFANEVLQRQFNHHTFVLEAEEFKAEGLDIASIPFRDNQTIIDLIAKKPLGLMPILEDQGLTGRKAHAMNNLTDKKLLDLFHQQHHRAAPHPNYQKPRFECDQFTLLHFAGAVTYDIAGFLEKNNDSLQGDLKGLLMDSADPFVRTLVGFTAAAADDTATATTSSGSSALPKPPTTSSHQRGAAAGGEAKLAQASTVSQTFRRQLDDLVDQLSATEPHFIKCIKPNTCKAPGGWSSQLVIQQLRCSGVLEVVRIRREAFPTRITFCEFYKRFGQLINWKTRGLPPPDTISESEAKLACADICAKALEPEAYQLGIHKVFLKDDGLDRLRWALQQHFVSAAVTVQTAWRGHVQRREYARAAAAALTLHAAARGLLARKAAAGERAALLARRTAAAVVIQKYVRRMQARKWGKAAITEARRRNAAAISIQRGARGMAARKLLRKGIAAAVALQCAARGAAARKTFCSMKTQDRLRKEREGRKATKMEAWARMVLARKALARARFAATRIQTAVRRWLAVRAYKKAVAAIVSAQSGARAVMARRRYRTAVAAVTLVQSLARRKAAKAAYDKALAAARRIQVRACT